MTELVTVRLPDEVAQRARQAGLLSDGAIQALLEDALRRTAGRELLASAQAIQAAGIPPMSMDEITAEVKAVRAERRAKRDHAAQPPTQGMQ